MQCNGQWWRLKATVTSFKTVELIFERSLNILGKPANLWLGYRYGEGWTNPTHTHTLGQPAALTCGFLKPVTIPRVEGEWGEWVEGERETGKVMTMQCATHMLRRLFLSLYVVWWHGMQPTCCVIYLIPSMLFDDVACNPHTTSSISFSPCCLMMWCATHMLHHLFLSLYVVW